MRHSVFHMTRLVSVMVMVASLISALTGRVPVTLAESDAAHAVKQSASNLATAMEKSSADGVPASVDRDAQNRLKAAYGKLPMSFEANRGQTDARVKFLSRGAGYLLFLTPTEAVLALQNAEREERDDRNQRLAISDQQLAALRMKMVGANPEPQITGEDQLPGKSNYLIGDDPKNWQKNVPLYAKVRYREVYPGVDLLYYGNQSQLEYDFIVAPQADPNMIALDFEGADALSLDREGNLVLRTGAGEVIQHAPTIYQETDGVRHSVSGHYIIKDRHRVGFEVGAYDRSKPLMIDPVVQFSTYLGGGGVDAANGIAVDAAGNAYVTGETRSVNFPTQNPFSNALQSDSDAFITKFTSDGSALVYSTFIGGNFADAGNSIAVTKDGRACITGKTGEDIDTALTNNFPTTANALLKAGDTNKRRVDAFVTVLNAAGSTLVYSTFYGGTKTRPQSSEDIGRGIAVDATGNVYITGRTASFDLPIKNAFQTVLRPDFAAFIAKFNPTASNAAASLLYSSYFGCHSGLGVVDEGNGIAVDKFGIAYIVGKTKFAQFFPSKSPSSLPPFQKRDPGGSSAFVAKFDCARSGNSSLTYATLLGGSDNDEARAVAVDSLQRTYITGTTDSSDFPLKNPFDSTFNGNIAKAFVTKMNADGTALFYSSFLGGTAFEEGRGIAVDKDGNAYVTGETISNDFPVLNAFQSTKAGGEDGFITKISPVPSTSVSPHIVYSSFLGGGNQDLGKAVAVGRKNTAFVAGFTLSNNFPTTLGAFQKNPLGQVDDELNGIPNGFVARIAEVNADTVGTFRPADLTYRLRNSNTSGSRPNFTVNPDFYEPGDLPVTGDFDGDGTDTTGIFRNGFFILSNEKNGLPTDIVVFGQVGDLPVAGDWNGDGIDTIGVYRPSTGQFLLRNKNTGGPADITVTFGGTGGTPVAGDWDADGDDTVGVYRDNNHTFFLRNKFDEVADIVVAFGIAGDIPVTGDWDGDGDDTIGVFRNSTHKFILRDVNTAAANLVVDFGAVGDTPLAGDWDGLSSNTFPNNGVNQPAAGSSAVGQAQLFLTTCSDPDGWRNIHTIDFKIAKTGAQGVERIALWAQFDQNRNRVRLYNPDNQRWSEGVPGSNQILSNRFVKLRLPGSMVEGSGPTGPSVQVTWNVVFDDSAVMDEYQQYLRIEDDAGFSTGFDEVGSWNVTP